MPEYWDWSHGAPLGIFGFVIVIVLINAVASVMRTRAKQDVIREAIRAGHDISPDMVDALQDKDSDDGGIVPGLILMAVAGGLVFLGYQIGKVEPDEPIFDIMLGVAAIPFLIGLVLFVAALVRPKKKAP